MKIRKNPNLNTLQRSLGELTQTSTAIAKNVQEYHTILNNPNYTIHEMDVPLEQLLQELERHMDKVKELVRGL